MMWRGFVSLVGAGPGDPGLITVKGLERLRAADVVLFDRLIPSSLLSEARGDALLIDVGKTPSSVRNPQSRINELIVLQARSNRRVVRLKGGDPFVFGRASEELDACRENAIACEVIPGISSSVAAPAAAGIPVTARGIARSYAVITAHDKSRRLPDHDFEALSKIDTIVVLMGLRHLGALTRQLSDAGRSGDTPVATIASATMPNQRVVEGTLATISDLVRDAGLESPVVTVIGEVVQKQHKGADESNFANTSESSSIRFKRVVVTQAESTSGNLQRSLRDRGADVIRCPMIRIEYPAVTDQVSQSLKELCEGAFDWVAFTSVHGVRAFRQAVEAMELDARVFGRAAVAALGVGTAAELSKFGIQADLIPRVALAERFVEEIDAFLSIRADGSSSIVRSTQRVLFPRGELALPTLKRGLESRGYDVVDPIVYQSTAATPSETTLDELRAGFDAILFCSPSAVARFAELSIHLDGALVGCIGPTTAAAARQHGIAVDVVPDVPGSAGLVDALADRFEQPETVS